MRSNRWELHEAYDALREGDVKLARRYIEKALEAVECTRCGEPLDDGRPFHPYFKGFRHDDCEFSRDRFTAR